MSHCKHGGGRNSHTDRSEGLNGTNVRERIGGAQNRKFVIIFEFPQLEDISIGNDDLFSVVLAERT